MATPAAQNVVQGPSQIAPMPYPGIAKAPAVDLSNFTAGGTPNAASTVKSPNVVGSDMGVGVPGALSINPAYAGDFYASRYYVQHPVPGDVTPNKGVSGTKIAGVLPNAQTGAPGAFKNRAAPKSVVAGPGYAEQPVLKYPWRKKYIPPLALFNDASQWVNSLFFVRTMTWFGADTSNPPVRGQYHSPPPLNTVNLAAGTLNAQLQLGIVAMQAQQLSVDASNYFGGS